MSILLKRRRIVMSVPISSISNLPATVPGASTLAVPVAVSREAIATVEGASNDPSRDAANKAPRTHDTFDRAPVEAPVPDQERVLSGLVRYLRRVIDPDLPDARTEAQRQADDRQELVEMGLKPVLGDIVLKAIVPEPAPKQEKPEAPREPAVDITA
jgi:hypothetical protein